MLLETALRPPLLTADLPALGGRIKTVPEDFEVEEIPAYQPSGQGDFLYLWLEKTDMGAEYFQRQIARRLEIAVGEVGTAGLKDRRAVTRQLVSVPAAVEPRLPRLEGEGLRLLQVGRHGNKLRPGHLHGNRFRLLIRNLDPTVAVAEVWPQYQERLCRHGLPNYYGSQRFGHDGETLLLGLALLRGQRSLSTSSGRTLRARSPFLRKLALSAAQSALFNCYLAQRCQDGLLRRVLPGDVLAKIPFGGLFVAEDLAREQQRFDAGETVTAGPIFGRKTFPAAQQAADREAALLTQCSLTPESFAGFGKLLQGTRRHNLIYLQDLAAELEPEGLRLSFTLPAGSYATILLRELLKSDLGGDEDEGPATS